MSNRIVYRDCLEAFAALERQRMARQSIGSRAYHMGRTLALSLLCAVATVGCAVAQIGGVL